MLSGFGRIFKLLSYDIFNDVYRVRFGLTGPEYEYVEIPGDQYPINEYLKGTITIKWMCNRLKF